MDVVINRRTQFATHGYPSIPFSILKIQGRSKEDFWCHLARIITVFHVDYAIVISINKGIRVFPFIGCCDVAITVHVDACLLSHFDQAAVRIVLLLIQEIRKGWISHLMN